MLSILMPNCKSLSKIFCEDKMQTMTLFFNIEVRIVQQNSSSHQGKDVRLIAFIKLC